jgi:inner membrane protein
MAVDELTYWHWLILAVGLMILEIFAPGAFFLWLAIASAAVGGLVWLLPSMSWEYQLLLFSVLSVISILIWRRYFRTQPADTDQPALNRRGEQYIGRTFTLDEPIVNGLGKIRVDDSTWKIAGEDCARGTRIKVVGAEGTLLRVEPRP